MDWDIKIGRIVRRFFEEHEDIPERIERYPQGNKMGWLELIRTYKSGEYTVGVYFWNDYNAPIESAKVLPFKGKQQLKVEYKDD